MDEEKDELLDEPEEDMAFALPSDDEEDDDFGDDDSEDVEGEEYI